MTALSEHLADELLLRYLAEGVGPEEQGALEDHLDGCPDCAAALERLAHVETPSGLLFLQSTAGMPEPPLRPFPALPARYEPLFEVGRGGMGLVLKVRDRELRREVALKTLKAKLPEDDPRMRRFLEEAHITAQLQHPGIPPVYEMGWLPDERPYFALKLVKGQTLADRLSARPAPGEGLAEFLRVFEQICEALAYAHRHGVIHRDVKPLNVMIGAHGEVHVMDWGLAKLLARSDSPGADSATAAGDERTVIETPERAADQHTSGMLGTYGYMAPEQARGQVHRQDERSDVFGLGAMLCEILTGLPAYAGPGPARQREQALDADLAPAQERLDRCGAPSDLAALARQCLAEDRDDRPRDAEQVSAAIRAFREGEEERTREAELQAAAARAEAAKANEVARAERRAHWRALAVGLLLLVLVAGGAWWLWRERQAARELERLYYVARISEVARDLNGGRPFPAEEGLRSLAGLRDLDSLRSWEWPFLHRWLEAYRLTLRDHRASVSTLAATAGGTLLASGSGDNEDPAVRLWDAGTGKLLTRLTAQPPPGGVTTLAFSDDDTLLLSAHRDRTVLLWNVSRRVVHLRIPEAGSKAALSPDGRWLVADGRGHEVRVWDARSGKVVIPSLPRRQLGATNKVECLAFSPDGKRLVCAGWGDTPEAWDTATWEPVDLLPPGVKFGNQVSDLAFSPDGKLLAAATGRNARIWNLHTAAELAGPVEYGVCNRVIFDRRGGPPLLALAFKTGRVMMWDVEGEKAIINRPLPLGGGTLALLSGDKGHRLAFPRREAIVVEQWHAPVSPPERTRLDSKEVPLAIGPGGLLLASARAGTITVWDTRSGKPLRRLNAAGREMLALALSRDEKFLAGASKEGTLSVWDLPTGRLNLTVQRPTPVEGLDAGVGLSEDGRYLAACTGTVVKVWDVASGEHVATSPTQGVEKHTQDTTSVAFGRNGRVASASRDGTVILWDRNSGQTERLATGHDGTVTGLAFSPDGRRLATASLDHSVKLWDLDTRRELLTLPGGKLGVVSVVFSGDGHSLTAALRDGTVKVWDASPGGVP